MTHVVCPLCGLNRPLSGFEPENFELDLKIRTQHSLGRGSGFSYTDQSVLGDDEFSPMFATQSLNVIKMFLDSGTLDRLDVFKKLGVADAHLKDLLRNLNFIIDRNQEISSSLKYYKNQTYDLERKISKLEKSIKDIEKKNTHERMVEKILLEIVYSGVFDTILIEENSFVNLLIHVDRSNCRILYDFIRDIEKEIWRLLRKRLLPLNLKTNVILKFFNELIDPPKPKPTIDRLLEYTSDKINEEFSILL